MNESTAIASALLRVVQPTTGDVDDLFDCTVLKARMRQRVCIERQFQCERNAFGSVVTYAAHSMCVNCKLGRRVADAFPVVRGDRKRPPAIGLVGFPRSGTTLDRIVTDPEGEDEGMPSVGARCEQDLLERDRLGDQERMEELNRRIHGRGVCRFCGQDLGDGGVDGVCAARMCRSQAAAKVVSQRPPVDRVRIMELYDAGWSTTAIAMEFGFSQARAYDLIRKIKLERNRDKPLPRDEARRTRRSIVIRMLGEGRTREQIAGALGVTLPSANELVRHALKRSNGGHRASPESGFHRPSAPPPTDRRCVDSVKARIAPQSFPTSSPPTKE